MYLLICLSLYLSIFLYTYIVYHSIYLHITPNNLNPKWIPFHTTNLNLEDFMQYIDFELIFKNIKIILNRRRVEKVLFVEQLKLKKSP